MFNQHSNDGPDDAPDVVGRGERIRAAKEARRALIGRPRLSLRAQIYFAFFLSFLLDTLVASYLVKTTYDVEENVRLLEIISDYSLRVEEARRFEKNFFLYGTGLDAAQQAIYQATTMLRQVTADLDRIMRPGKRAEFFENIDHYERLLEELSRLERGEKGEAYDKEKKRLEIQVREQGHKMVSFAGRLIKKEKRSMSEAMARTRNLHFVSLAVIMVSMILIAYILGSQLITNITRFEKYATRIAGGNFTPIMPARRFRDEFTDLALSINQMILELESHEMALIQAHKMRAVGTLTAGVAHELNNPLNNITLTTHMLLEDLEELEPGEQQELIADVIEEADRARNIVANLLDFARESGAKLEPLDIEEVVEGTLRLAGNELKLSGVKVDLSVTEDLPRIHGDSQQLRQVFLNLILNAVAASEKGGRIQVIALPADDPKEVAVKVIDFGSGIPEPIMDRIFEPFFSTKEKGKGTGLGLSVSQGIVAKHRGRIRVSSRPGKGTTFTVTLPVVALYSEVLEELPTDAE